MRHAARTSPLATLTGALLASALLAAAGAPVARASFGVQERNFEAATCAQSSCTYAGLEQELAKTGHSEAFTQAAGHPPWGITAFELNHTGSGGARLPEGQLKRIRVDVPPGLAADPQALPTCKKAQFESNPKLCPLASQVGTTEMEAVTEPLLVPPILLPPLSGIVYNLELEPGLPLDFGIAVEPASPLIAAVHLFLKGHDAWNSDYHEYFEIDDVPMEGEVLGGLKAPLRVLKSKLNFNGRAGQGNFLTLPSLCTSINVTHLEVESYEGEISRTQTHPPVGVEGCDKVPFAPSTAIAPETAQSDAPDGATALVTAPQKAGPAEINTGDVKDVHVTLPEGLTLNPSAAHGLQACTPAQIGIGTTAPVACPAAARVGTVTIETDLPAGSLSGPVYLGTPPGGGPITEPPYTVYLDAESEYGVSVRLRALVSADPQTGRLQASVPDLPQLPFGQAILTLNGGPRAPLANPLACGTGQVQTLFTPYTGGPPALSSSPFAATGCPAPLPFALAQSTQTGSPNAGAYTSYTFNLARADGQQYLSRVSTVLPPGLVGVIPSVARCGEPQAQDGTCPPASQIGQASVSVGSGPEPYALSGPVYLTGPYAGAPFGLSVAVPATAGPFDLGGGPCDCVVTRATIGVDPHSGRVIATSALPTIVRGVPLRLRGLSVAVDRPNFLLNPTSCGPLATDSTLTSTFGALQAVSSPFAVANCNALAFKPSFKTSTGARTSIANGASLQVKLTQPAHEANLRSVFVQLPRQLPARLSTLQKACPEATFAQNPRICPPGALVGGAVVRTPVLPDPLSGPAYLVSHGGLAFPDLDLVLEGDGVQVILTGNTHIRNGITTSTFASIPDVPVSSATVTLPVGPHSALAATGNLCASRLAMPTTLTAQNGAQVRRATAISVTRCPVTIIARRISGHTLILKVRTFEAGRLTVRAANLRTVARRLRKAATLTLKVPLSRNGLHALRRRRQLRARVRVSFAPAKRAAPRSAALLTVRFR